MQKLIPEVRDGNDESLCEPIFLEDLATPIVVTARAQNDRRRPVFLLRRTAAAAERWVKLGGWRQLSFTYA